MALSILGGGIIDGELGKDPDFSLYNGKLGRTYTGVAADNTLKFWIVQEAQAAGGVEMANGLFANPTRVEVLAAVNSVNGEIGDVELRTVNILSDGGLLSINKPNEIQATQSNPFPLASSVVANSYLDIVVAKENTPITTTHLPSGSDTTSGDSGDGFIIEWETGGLKRFVSDGISKWREI